MAPHDSNELGSTAAEVAATLAKMGAAEQPEFTKQTNLLSEDLGAKALGASDDFFAACTNLTKPGRGVFIADKFTERGKWMDGWESRRKRSPGNDWCILQLAGPCKINGLDIDTNHFTGNHPSYASVDVAVVEGENVSFDELLARDDVKWIPLLGMKPLKPGQQNFFAVDEPDVYVTHLRLNIFPDGGVARLRAYGQLRLLWDELGGDVVDVASMLLGGKVVTCSNQYFADKSNLIKPGRGVNMGDGWESKRRRGPGHDWIIVRLGKAVEVDQLLVDTQHFKGNFPHECSVDACYLENSEGCDISLCWEELLPKKRLSAHNEHFFEKSELKLTKKVNHVRLNIYPDGGVMRFRVFAKVNSGTEATVPPQSPALQRRLSYVQLSAFAKK